MNTIAVVSGSVTCKWRGPIIPYGRQTYMSNLRITSSLNYISQWNNFYLMHKELGSPRIKKKCERKQFLEIAKEKRVSEHSLTHAHGSNAFANLSFLRFDWNCLRCNFEIPILYLLLILTKDLIFECIANSAMWVSKQFIFVISFLLNY